MISKTHLIVYLTIVVSAAFAAPAEPEVGSPANTLERDEWYRFKDMYTDAPRIFDFEDYNKCPVNVDQFYLDCNHCACGEGRVDFCTRIACSAPPQILNWEAGKACPAGQKFYFKCNDCTCHENGTSATCTDKPCPEPAHN